MKDLLIALYALLALYRSETALKEPTQALKKATLKPFFALIPGLEEAIRGAFRGDFDFTDLGVGIKDFLKVYEKDPSSRVSVKKLLGAFGLWMRTDSGAAMKTIELNSASTVFPHWASSIFINKLESQAPVNKKLNELIRKMTGKPGLGFVTSEEREHAAQKFPNLYKEYLAVRREFTNIWKGFLANLVRESGKKIIPYQEALKRMKAAGINHMLPLGFKGGIDAAGRWYSPFGELMNINPNAAMYPTVVMNPEYTEGADTWICQAIYADGTGGARGYTKISRRDRADEKFAAVRDFVPVVDKIRKKWIVGLKQFDVHKPETIACLILELLFQTSARVGHFSAVRKKNYLPIQNGHGFQLKYQGKAGVLTKHKYVGVDPLSKFVVKCVAQLAEDKKPNDFLFTAQGRSGFKRIPPALINAMFRKLGAQGISVHKLRTYNGTKLFNAEMDKIYARRKNLTPKEAIDILKAVATKVGKLLNHVKTSKDGSTVATPATALASYIDISAQVAFFQHYELPMPKALERFAGGDEEKDSIHSSTDEYDGVDEIVASFDLGAADGGSAKPVTPKPEKPKPVKPPEAKKMQETPDAVGLPKSLDGDQDGDYDKDNEEKPHGNSKADEEEPDDSRAPNAPLPPATITPKDIKEEEKRLKEEEEQELKDDEAREMLGEQAQKIAEQMFNGGGGDATSAYEVQPGRVENLLVKRMPSKLRP